MKPGPRPLALAAALIALGALGARAQSAVEPRAVVELFTSQGCSSCPPADALVLDLAKNPALIAITLPVTYWDYLGWKDTLGKDAFAKRQKFYAKARGDGQVYTPQIVVNGTAHLVGSDKDEVEKAVRQLPASGFEARIVLKETAGELEVEVKPSATPEDRKAGIWLLQTTRQVTVPITRGENQGRTLSYANVVRGMQRIGDWNGRETRLSVPLAGIRTPDADGYVVVVQADLPGKYGIMPGAVLGAARAPGTP